MEDLNSDTADDCRIKRFLTDIFARKKFSNADMLKIVDLPGHALSFFTNCDEVGLTCKLTLIERSELKFADIAAIDADDHPLLQLGSLQELVAAANKLNEMKAVKAQEVERQRLASIALVKEIEKEKQQAAIQLSCYKKLRQSLEEHLLRITPHKKATQLKDWLAAAEEAVQLDRNSTGNKRGPYQIYLDEKAALLAILEIKRKDYRTSTSYTETVRLLIKLDAIHQNPIVIAEDFQAPVEPPVPTLGNTLLELLFSDDRSKINNAHAIFTGFNDKIKKDFITEYCRVFFDGVGTDKASGPDVCLAAIFAEDNLAAFNQLLTNDTNARQKLEWVLRYALEPHMPHLSNGFDSPVVTIDIENPTIADIAASVNKSAKLTDAVYFKLKSGGANAVGEFGARYNRYTLIVKVYCGHR